VRGLVGRSIARALAPAAAVLLAACATPVTPPTHIVVVLIDTLRADRLGAYGSTRGLTPFLDSLAERGVVFRNAWAPAPHTRPSVASLFTSRFPSEHGTMGFGHGLAEQETTLAEVLSGRDWWTAGFLGTGVIEAKSGFAQGFAVYDAPAGGAKRGGLHIRQGLLRSMETLRSGRPSFLYVHYMEPHIPWAPPAYLLTAVRPDIPLAEMPAISFAMLMARYQPPDATMRAKIEAVYDAEVATVDAEIRALFEYLPRQGFLDDAVIVITADHGEGFGGHDLYGHGNSLYEELIHVPLIVVLPRQSRGRTVDEPVTLVDVAPTLLDLAGVPAPPSFEGRSLRRQLEGGLAHRFDAAFEDARPVFSERPQAPSDSRRPGEALHETAVRIGARKLVHNLDGSDETYDLRRDPGERRPERAAAGPLAAALDQFRAAHTEESRAPKTEIDPDTAERLKALGYVVDH